MVRFSCFHASIPSSRNKKQGGQHSFETMLKVLEAPQTGPVNNSVRFNQAPAEGKDSNDLVERGWRSGEINDNVGYNEVTEKGHMRRSLSLGCTCLHEGRIFEENGSENNTDQEFSVSESHDHHTSFNGPKSPEATIPDQLQETMPFEFPHFGSEKLNTESIFSVGDLQYPEQVEQEENDCDQLDNECAGDSDDHTPRTPPVMAKARSLPNLSTLSSTTGEAHSPHGFQALRSRSSEDLNALNTMRKQISISEVIAEDLPDQNEGPNEAQDWCDSFNYGASSKDWIVPILDDDDECKVQNLQGESPSYHLDQMPSQEFKIKRIEDWMIDIQECDQIIEPEVVSDSRDLGKKPISSLFEGRDAAKADMRLNPGAEAAKRYISSLGASATTAQLGNHGLAVIPFLSAFLSLKVVNLSGNSIAKITSGALPRGLHMLNLSKNKISAIEGLRELTRVRILDLSYNKITRIGHGLSSCSSLKEVYLAGNKISEVEGLHRLLKLTVLDLRFNKISTTKCLGQLAANYNSLQAVSLEGNPAQKNVGDEQLKKYLLGLLPHLAYYNRQSTSKNSSLKDSDRSLRLSGVAHKSDRSHKSDHKSSSRRLTLATGGANKQSGHRGQAMGDSPKKGSSRSRHGNLPPASGSRSGLRHHHHQQLNVKPLDLEKEFAMRKSQSMGALFAL